MMLLQVEPKNNLLSLLLLAGRVVQLDKPKNVLLLKQLR